MSMSPTNASRAIVGAFKGLEEMLIALKTAGAELESEGRMPDAARGLKYLLMQVFAERSMLIAQLVAAPDADVERVYRELQQQFADVMTQHSIDAERIAEGKPITARKVH